MRTLRLSISRTGLKIAARILRSAARLLCVSIAAVSLALSIAAGAKAAEDGWKEYDAVGLAFSAPASMRPPSADSGGVPAFDVDASDWNFTLTNRPDRPDAGLTITFLWSADVTSSPSGGRSVARSSFDVGLRKATRTEWTDDDMNWRGVDVVVPDLKPGRLFKATCHAPKPVWSKASATCDAIVASLKWSAIDAAPDFQPGQGLKDESADASPAATPAPTSDAAASTPAASGSPPSGFAPWIAGAAAAGAAIVLLLATRLFRKRKASEPPKAAAVEQAAPSGTFCPYCGARAAATARFCESCGKQLPDAG